MGVFTLVDGFSASSFRGRDIDLFRELKLHPWDLRPSISISLS